MASQRLSQPARFSNQVTAGLARGLRGAVFAGRRPLEGTREDGGAVQAALQCRLGGATEPGRIAELLDAILPALQGIDPSEPPAARLHRAVEANVRWAVRQLAATPAGGAALADGRIGLIGAVYELATGRVRFLREEGPQALRNPS